MNPIDTSEKEKNKVEFGSAYGSTPVLQK